MRLGPPKARAGVAAAAALAALLAWWLTAEPKFVLGSLVGVPLAYLAYGLDKAWLTSAAVASYVFLGQSANMGLPLDPGRVLVALVVLRFAVDAYRVRAVPALDRWQAWWLWAALAFVIGSVFAAGQLSNHAALFEILDAYGVVPFLLFILAPWAFDTPGRQRAFLLSLLSTALYLGVTGTLEGLGLGRLTFPRYIDDPTVGIHYGRARGPFASAVPMGSAVSLGVVVSVLAAQIWTSRRLRAVAALTGSLCFLALMFTLTRGAWVGLAPAVAVAIGFVPGIRRWLPIAFIVATTVIAGSLTASPALKSKITERNEAQASVWERENTNAAAVRLIAEHPLLGIGWDRYAAVGDEFLVQPDDLPLYGTGVVVHNQFLLLASELGLLGLAVWIFATAACVIVPSMRRGPPAMRPWQAATLAALLITWVNGLFAPPTFPYVYLTVWVLAGIVRAQWSAAAAAPIDRDSPLMVGRK
ncbi:MAG: O-antigen ligase family protein [Beijerinckiaceae bacterium]|nr:O-antigen ligase family protein [Beijerinckiaceae bacterium]